MNESNKESDESLKLISHRMESIDTRLTRIEEDLSDVKKIAPALNEIGDTLKEIKDNIISRGITLFEKAGKAAFVIIMLFMGVRELPKLWVTETDMPAVHVVEQIK